jgi:hypothetical protein
MSQSIIRISHSSFSYLSNTERAASGGAFGLLKKVFVIIIGAFVVVAL